MLHFCFGFVLDSWLVFCTAHRIVIDLPTIAISKDVAFFPLKAIAKSKGKLIAIVFKRKKERQLSL